MNNLDILPHSGERLSFYQLFSIKNFKIEIPIIQRDYAQGRAKEHEVRSSFLNALHDYLTEGKPNRDLDFVYGSVVNKGNVNQFIPLDGQQRLTTLFLLHWYLAQVSGRTNDLRSVLSKDGCSLFSYETRVSSNEFCNALVANDIDVNNLIAVPENEQSFSATIKDKSWFYLSWASDPTIKSMLIMLDSIHDKFYNCSDFYNKLVDLDKPVITFLFLNLKDFNLTDDLYIKMNARGKPLNPFENFKAKLEKVIKGFRGEWPEYKLTFKSKDRVVSGYEYFIHKIDTDWANLFWFYRKENDDKFNEDEKRNEDDELMNFIALIISNFSLLRENVPIDEQRSVRGQLLGHSGKLNNLSFFDYEKIDCFNQELIKHLIKVLDLVHNNGSTVDQIHSYLNDDCYYSENKIFKKVIRNDTNYTEKLRFYAFYTYLAKIQDVDQLMSWSRVIFNLTENTIINTSDAFNKALFAINSLSQHDEPILNALKNDCSISTFSGAQILEEKIKAHLILKSERWTDAIVEIEKHFYFHGQIGFILNFSGVLDFFQREKHCEWGQSQDDEYFIAFQRYAEAGSAIFSTIGNSSSALNFLWERAVLSKGIYFTKATADRYNMLSTRLTKNNIERDHSWRRLLRPLSKELELKQGYVKEVFDDPIFDVDNLQQSLSDICNNALNDSDIESWRKVFIKYGEIFSVCQQGFISILGDEIILLGESQRNHNHAELRTRALDFELRKISESIEPFKIYNYHSVKTRYESAYAIVGCSIDNVIYSIIINFDSGHFQMMLFTSEPSDITCELIDIFNKNDFKPISENDSLRYFINDEYVRQEELIERLLILCSDLNEYCL